MFAATGCQVIGVDINPSIIRLHSWRGGTYSRTRPAGTGAAVRQQWLFNVTNKFPQTQRYAFATQRNEKIIQRPANCGSRDATADTATAVSGVDCEREAGKPVVLSLLNSAPLLHYVTLSVNPGNYCLSRPGFSPGCYNLVSALCRGRSAGAGRKAPSAE